ncbi:DUF7768 domain-containing protein [Actinotignum urinale]|uniref:DUF7768 domain-containing protein n=1 Tax=Actinotignum urinale TaxID=190146 RepID=UPI00280B1B05|nr:BRO family protein [Actinotignum urinale]
MGHNQLQVFTNSRFGTVRTVEDDAGRVLFYGRDVATALGYENPGKAVRNHARADGGPKRYPIIDVLGRPQEAVFITEGDVYLLIASSKLSTAVQFESWIFDEVLPSIRKHGLYAIDALLDDDDLLSSSPYSGDVQANVELARQFCGFSVSSGKIPFAPHLLFPQFMDDANPNQRELAMFMSRVLLAKCEALWAYVGHVSPGVRLEIGWARDLDLPIKHFDSKGELLITIMSSLAQEESRSISENVTWGHRRWCAEGKALFPYSNFLGYTKNADGQITVIFKGLPVE